MATHSCILTWRIPWTEELCRLELRGSHKVRHDLVTKQQQDFYAEITLACSAAVTLPSLPHVLVHRETEKYFYGVMGN